MPEFDVADARETGRGDTILVSVVGADGGVIARALRERGFAVVEAPIDAVAARVIASPPTLLVLDLDEPGSRQAADQARAASGAEVLFVGDVVRAADLGVAHAERRVFERPVDVEALVTAVLAFAEPRAPGTMPPPTLSRAGRTTPPRARGESDPPPSEYPSTSDPLDVAALLPLDEAESPSAVLAQPELSPELARILEAAEQRVSALRQAHPSGAPEPEEAGDFLLAPDLLASLDEPLEPEDDVSARGASTAGTGHPKRGTAADTTGAATGARVDRGTGADALRASRTWADAPIGGREGLPAPSPSEPGEAGSEAPASTGAEELPARSAAVAGSPPSKGREPPPARSGEAVAPPRPHAAREAAQARAPRTGTDGPVRPGAPSDARAIPEGPRLPAVLVEGVAVRALAAVISARASGSLSLGLEGAQRRVVLHDGDIMTAASASADETLVAFLVARGDLERDVATRLASRLPPQGRHAGAALIAHGHLGQDDLWPVLRAHAEWIIGRALGCDEGLCELESEPPGRLRAEPNVFGGATGAEVFLEQIRRVVAPDVALRRLGGGAARVADGARRQLLVECALRPDDEQRVRDAAGRTVGEILAGAEPELAVAIYGLVSLGVLDAHAPEAPAEPSAAVFDELEEEAFRQRVRARLALVEDGDYFALLGIPRTATGYEIRRAYLELRRAFEPHRVLTAATADLAPTVRLVVDVLEEAYDVLREPHRRDRYRRAIEAGPP